MGKHTSPVVYSSFGKDSMVMLDLVRRAGYHLPIIFHREAFDPKKYEFANQVIQRNGYTVYDWPPQYMEVSKSPEGEFEIINRHQVRHGVDYLPIGIRPPVKGKPFLCGLEDFYRKPTGTFSFPWDLGFVGHKSVDIDPMLGPVPLVTDYINNSPACSLAFPLRYFTNEDIWEYTVSEGLPISRKRYNSKDGYREFQDTTWNPDYFTCCVACMDKDAPARVPCPKTGGNTINVSQSLNWRDVPPRPAHIEGGA